MERSLKDTLDGDGFGRVDAARSKTMSSIRSNGNRTTEVSMRMLMVRSGVSSWRMNNLTIDGKPDFFFPAARIAIFVDGCFWHCCRRCGHFPKTRSDFWRAKLMGNKLRDQRTSSNLRSKGIRVIRIWEHELAGMAGQKTVVRRICRAIGTLQPNYRK
jgi:DNA mismatch endonuclease, patch repair protein